MNLKARAVFYFFNAISFYLVTLGLPCCLWAFSSCSEQGLLCLAVHGLLMGWLLLSWLTGCRHAGQ